VNGGLFGGERAALFYDRYHMVAIRELGTPFPVPIRDNLPSWWRGFVGLWLGCSIHARRNHQGNYDTRHYNHDDGEDSASRKFVRFCVHVFVKAFSAICEQPQRLPR